MATMILLPDADGSIQPGWVAVGETDRWDCLKDDNGNTSYVKCSTNTASMIIEYANPSIAESGIASIESVRFLSSGRSTHRTSGSIVSIGYQVPSGNVAELCTYDAHRTNYETINGTARTTSDGSSAAWTYTDLERLEMICIKSFTVNVRLSYLALEVTYTEAVSADNATFFGANF